MIRCAIFLAILTCNPALAAPRIAFTFDDLPAHAPLPPGVSRVDVARDTIAALREAKVPSVLGFVNGVGLVNEPQSAPVLQMWRDAGFLLGNHTWSHAHLSGNTLQEYETEITRNEPALEKSSPDADWHWFRYPYLDEGDSPEQRAAIRSFLTERGYKIAPVTMGFSDWQYSEPYARCAANNDAAAIAEMEKMYLAAAEESIPYGRSLSQTLYGRDIPYVLLMHIGAFEARMMGQLLALYRAKGFEFVSLEEAERDPYYRAFADPSQPAPLPDLEHQVWAQGGQVPRLTDYAPRLKAICR